MSNKRQLIRLKRQRALARYGAESRIDLPHGGQLTVSALPGKPGRVHTRLLRTDVA